MKNKLFLVFLPVIIGFLVSCEEDKPSISLNKSVLSLSVGIEEILVATVSPSDAVDKSVVWSSDRPEIATVDNNGKVTAVALGDVTIAVATADGKKKATCAVTVEFVAWTDVPAGTFRMGYLATAPGEWDEDVNFDEGTRHQVTLSKGFKMSRNEITNAQYCAFLNDNGIGRNGIWSGAKVYRTETLIYDSSDNRSEWGIAWDEVGDAWVPLAGKEHFPVIYVTWFGAKEFAAWLGGDLPTEAQWERACRADRGTMPFGIGSGKMLDGAMANIYGRYICDTGEGEKDLGEGMGIYLRGTCAVGNYQSNSYGLYDMHGNVFEWCNDWYDTNYGSANATDAATDPTGPETGSFRIVRGGCWGSGAWDCHAANRYSFSPYDAYDHIGFRVVLQP